MSKLAAEFTYTDAELLDLYREAYAKLSVLGQETQMLGKRVTRADLPAIQQQIQWLEQRVDAANATRGPNRNYAKFVTP